LETKAGRNIKRIHAQEDAPYLSKPVSRLIRQKTTTTERRKTALPKDATSLQGERELWTSSSEGLYAAKSPDDHKKRGESKGDAANLSIKKRPIKEPHAPFN